MEQEFFNLSLSFDAASDLLHALDQSDRKQWSNDIANLYGLLFAALWKQEGYSAHAWGRLLLRCASCGSA
jgi:hypothetical protein